MDEKIALNALTKKQRRWLNQMGGRTYKDVFVDSSDRFWIELGSTKVAGGSYFIPVPDDGDLKLKATKKSKWGGKVYTRKYVEVIWKRKGT